MLHQINLYNGFYSIREKLTWVLLVYCTFFLVNWINVLGNNHNEIWKEVTHSLADMNYNGTPPDINDPNSMKFYDKIGGLLRKDPDLWSWLAGIAEESKKDGKPLDMNQIMSMGPELLKRYKQRFGAITKPPDHLIAPPANHSETTTQH